MILQPTDFQQQVILKMGNIAVFNIEVGTLRYHDAGHDILSAIELLGRIDNAAKVLNVTVDVINQWLDDYYVPDIYANKLHQLTGYFVQSLQQPPNWTKVGENYWPPSGFTAEKNMLALYMRCERNQN
jgi:hypothetical protein